MRCPNCCGKLERAPLVALFFTGFFCGLLLAGVLISRGGS